MSTLGEAVKAWLDAQAEAARAGTADAAERAEEALQVVREHPAARRGGEGYGSGARDGGGD